METIAKVFHELYSDSLEVNRTRDQNESMLERSKLHKNSSFTSRIHNNFNLEQFIVTYAIASMGLSFVCKTRSCGCLRFRSQALANGLQRDGLRLVTSLYSTSRLWPQNWMNVNHSFV